MTNKKNHKHYKRNQNTRENSHEMMESRIPPQLLTQNKKQKHKVKGRKTQLWPPEYSLKQEKESSMFPELRAFIFWK